MADKKETKKTIYQNLNNMLNLDGMGFGDMDDPRDHNKQDAKIIIKGESPKDIQRKGLELQQQEALRTKFFKTTDHGFQKAMQYEAARLPAYLDYEGMEYYPIIASSLDLFMEEATTIGEDGLMLKIYSDKERIQSHLQEFFYDIANVNVNLPFWTRNLCKYGDNFTYLLGEKKKGITVVKQMVNYEMERVERIHKGKANVRFKQRETGDEFNLFEIAHFRLLGDDKYLPYGSCLVSDSYVKTNKGIKEIKDIIKGDVVVGFDIKTQKKIESNVLDVVCNGEKQTYKISTVHNYIKATDNHKILTYNYDENNFKYKLVDELKIGDGLIINNKDDYNEQIKIDKTIVIKETKNRKYGDFVKDLKYIPDYVDADFAKLFGFMVGDGGINNKRPYMVYFAYGTCDIINKKYIKLLEKYSNKKIYLRKNNRYSTGIASAVINSKALSTIFDNMGFVGNARTKRIPKWVFSTSNEIRKSFLEGIQDADGTTFIDKWNCERFSIELSNYDLINDIKLLIQSLGYKSGKICKRKKRENVIILGNKIINVADSYTINYYKSENKQTKVSDIKNKLTNDFIVEKIKSIELDKLDFVYDIYVDNENHNFYANNIVVHNSTLNKIRRVFRQLIMAEDAMLTYRILRAGEKRVFKIDVGNIDEDDIEAYIHKIATRFKKQQQVYPDSGQIDYRFNILGNDEDIFIPVRNANVQTGIDTLPGACLALDTKIDLLDGRSLSLNDIINEFDSSKKLWSYSINPGNGLIVPGEITWAGITRKNTQVLKLTLDNGETITCTPDHKFPTKYNGIKEAQNLDIGESMWAFNKKEDIIKGSGARNMYNMVYDHSKNDWIFTHRMVANFMKIRNLHENFNHRDDLFGENQGTIHHKDFNRYNNNPENLCFMNSRDHFYYHHDFAKECYNSYSNETKEKHKNLRKLGLDNYWKNISSDELILKKDVAKNNSIKSRDNAVETFNNNPNREKIIKLRGLSISKTKSTKENRKKQSKIAKLQWENTNLREIIGEKETIKYSNKLLDLLIDYASEYSRIDLILENIINIENSEWLNEFNSLNKNNKQLKKMSKITRNNIDKMLKHFDYINWRDFKTKIPCYNHKIVGIEWLDKKQDTGTITIDGNEQLIDYHNFSLSCGIFTLNSNLDQIHDIEYLRDNLFTGLGIPKPFLGFQGAAGDGKNLAQMDIRFSKKINRIQQAVIQELNKMAMIHLFLLEFENEDISNFTLSLTNPSTQQELLKTELLQQKAQVYTELTRNEGGIAAMSHTNAKRLLFTYSDKDIVDDFKKQRMERAVAQELQDSPLIIRQTGLFKDIDAKYGTGELPPEGSFEGGEEDEGVNDMNLPPIGGGSSEEAPQMPNDLPPVIGQGQGFKDNRNVIIENEDGKYYLHTIKPKMKDSEFDNTINKLVDDDTASKKKTETTSRKMIVDKKNKLLNEKATSMINEIDSLMKKSNTINTNNELDTKNFTNSKIIEYVDILDLNVGRIIEEDMEEDKTNKK